jgi:small GTP-binding protein
VPLALWHRRRGDKRAWAVQTLSAVKPADMHAFESARPLPRTEALSRCVLYLCLYMLCLYLYAVVRFSDKAHTQRGSVRLTPNRTWLDLPRKAGTRRRPIRFSGTWTRSHGMDDSAAPAAAASAAPPHNICIIAHVDHGKTTMADSLLASNGIVSHRLAGLGLRYMDSRDDEQDRGITMKASCIALSYEGGADAGGRCDINLIDSPGHVDFCSEVSAAARLSDGALLVVDAVEGVCVQTHAVLKQAWEEQVTPVLVLNKIDRLITELELSPLEAWHHLKTVVEQVNAIAGHLYTGAVLAADRSGASAADAADADGAATAGAADVSDATIDELQASVGELQFAPEKGNVLFASAMHGWGFSLHDFAKL